MGGSVGNIHRWCVGGCAGVGQGKVGFCIVGHSVGKQSVRGRDRCGVPCGHVLPPVKAHVVTFYSRSDKVRCS